MRYRFACILLLAGCASMPARIDNSANETLATPTQAARIIRQVFDAHRIPMRRTSDIRNVDSGWFEARSVWSAGEIDAVVACAKPKKDAQPGGDITMNVAAYAREQNRRNTIATGIATRATEYVTVISLRSSGRRSDGAKCKLSDEYSRQLLEEIVSMGGRPLRAEAR